MLKSGKWAKIKAFPQARLRQNSEACVLSSLWFVPWFQLHRDTVCHVEPRRTSSWPWHGELEPVSLTMFPGGQRGVCLGGPLRGNPPLPSPRQAPTQPGCLPSRGAACLAPVSFVLGDMARRGASQTLKQSPKAGPLGLETLEQRGTQSSGQGGAQDPAVQQDRPTLQTLLH